MRGHPDLSARVGRVTLPNPVMTASGTSGQGAELAGYFDAGKAQQKATFELTIRRLPEHRNFVIAAGLPQAVDYLLNLGFSDEEIEYLKGLSAFAQASAGFFEYLRKFRFTGDVFAVPEGTPLFSGEPMMIVRAPLVLASLGMTAFRIRHTNSSN